MIQTSMLLACFVSNTVCNIQIYLGFFLQADGNKLALTSLYDLESTISQRKAELAEVENGKPSWTKRLLLNDELLCSKIRLRIYWHVLLFSLNISNKPFFPLFFPQKIHVVHASVIAKPFS